MRKKKKSRRYSAETMTEADYADDLALIQNRPTQVESLWHEALTN